MKKWIKSILLMIGMMFIITGCGDGDDDYTSKVYELTEEETELLTSPSVEYIISALENVDTIIGVEEDCDLDDEYLGKVYFTSDMVSQDQFETDETVTEKGTDGGGSIDIFATVEDAIERDVYLHGFDDKVALNSGGHAVAGTIVIRTSSKLDEADQIKLTEMVLDALKSGGVNNNQIETVAETEESNLEVVPVIVETPEVEEEVAVVEKAEPVAEPEPAPQPEPQPQPEPAPQPEPEPEPQPAPAPAPEQEPQPAPQQQSSGGSFAVNGKNGKIHIVGKCAATGNGDSAMEQPVYFNTYEEAEAYSVQYHSGQKKRQCGNCW